MENKIVIEMLKKSKENAELMESLIDQNNHYNSLQLFLHSKI